MESPICNELAVLKLGGSVIQNLSDLQSLPALIEQYLSAFNRVAVVVSALKGMTDQLLSQAHTLSPSPNSRELDMLISIGERMSASLLCIALEARGISARSYTGSQAGILTSSEHSQAKIIDVQPYRLIRAFENHKVVVVAGFQGVSMQTKEITTLGRGGSDTSAVALAIALHAQRVVFFKDVGSLFEEDPHLNPTANSISFCDYQTTYELMQRPKFMLHPRAVQLANANAVPLHIASPLNPLKTGTLIASNPQFTDKVDFTIPAVYEQALICQ